MNGSNGDVKIDDNSQWDGRLKNHQSMRSKVFTPAIVHI